MFIYLYLYLYVIHIHVYIYIHVYIHIFIYIYIYIYVCMYVCIYINLELYATYLCVLYVYTPRSLERALPLRRIRCAAAPRALPPPPAMSRMQLRHTRTDTADRPTDLSLSPAAESGYFSPVSLFHSSFACAHVGVCDVWLCGCSLIAYGIYVASLSLSVLVVCCGPADCAHIFLTAFSLSIFLTHTQKSTYIIHIHSTHAPPPPPPRRATPGRRTDAVFVRVENYFAQTRGEAGHDITSLI